LVANLLFIRVFILIYSCFTRNYVMFFQSLSTRNFTDYEWHELYRNKH